MSGELKTPHFAKGYPYGEPGGVEQTYKDNAQEMLNFVLPRFPDKADTIRELRAELERLHKMTSEEADVEEVVVERAAPSYQAPSSARTAVYSGLQQDRVNAQTQSIRRALDYVLSPPGLNAPPDCALSSSCCDRMRARRN